MKIFNYILSARFMSVLLFIMAAAIGTATFIENEYDTITAKELVYNAKWFELVLLLLLLNFINNIKTYQLLKWKKWSVLLLHFGFIIALVGAFVSRYIGYEGVMLIQENDSSSEIYSSEPYFQIKTHNDSIQYNEEQQHNFSKVFTSYPDSKFEFPEIGQVSIKVTKRIPNAQKEFIKDTPGGKLYLHLVLPGRENLYLSNGEVVVKQGIPFAFNNNDREDAVKFFYTDNQLQVFAPFEINKVDMASLTVEDRQSGKEIPQDTLVPNKLHDIAVRNLVSFLGLQVMVNSVEQKAKLEYVSTDNDDLPDALLTTVKVGEESKTEFVLGKSGIRAIPTTLKCGGLFFSIAYGAKNIGLPFQVGLTDFRLMKYPGSESPSSYESDINIKDELNNFDQSYNLFMNHVVDYGGFRFFQSSYDWSNDQNKKAGLDPDITILSVNHDIIGTWITYLGYLLLAVGLLGTLFNPSSRFIEVRKKVIKMRNKRKTALITIAVLFVTNLFALENYSYKPIPSVQADSMGVLLVQTYEGRIQPTHSLAFDIFHKISKKNNFTTSDNQVLNPMQILVDMMLDKPYWLDQKIIYIRKGDATGLSDSLGIEGNYASVNDFFNDDKTEKLKSQIQVSFSKKDVHKSFFDKELIKANERMNIVLQTMNGSLLKIFPIAGSKDNKWVNWVDPYAELPIDTTDEHLSKISLSRLFKSYIMDLREAKKSNNYESAQSLLNFIKAYQIKTSPTEIILSKNQIHREISYNKSNLFVKVKNYYGYLAVFLLIFSFWDALSKKGNKLNKIVNYTLWGFITLLTVVFFMHTYSLALRWVVTGHAPWSNGYEALTFIAWGGVLAGFLFIRSSKITLAGTALLAFFTLMTAGHSSFDPQLTDLQPVLKSYWLVIHVACITISYGFLGLGFILGLINTVNYLFLKKDNKNLKSIIAELTHVNEMTLTIGLALATIGTFLGGIWANESWGRYWGWDAKETWALVIVLTYAIVLHFRLIPGLKSKFTFNVASVFAFSSVLMTFIGVNYYLSKGLHSYARGETPVFPTWAWITIASIIAVTIAAWWNKRGLKSSN
jgi:cytochrome c-type biogenesis protein CcsB